MTPPLTPRGKHCLEQYMALSLEVQAMLRPYKASLVAAGWTEAEAWALSQRVEERILGPMIAEAEVALREPNALRDLVRLVLDQESVRRN